LWSRRLGRVVLMGVLGVGPALAFLAAYWQGCSVYSSSLLEPGDGAGTSDASSCLAKWPPPPARDDPGSGTDYSGFVAMQTVDVGASADAAVVVSDSSAPLPPIGFDLDNDCTCCNAAAGGACPTRGSCVGSSVTCDDDAGRDHVALNIFRVLPNANAAASAGMQAGQYSILLQISAYNGTLNDTNVTVALYVSNGLVGIQDGGTVSPRHDGTDLWTVDTHYLATTQTGETIADGTQCSGTNACQPIYVDDGAYVANGVLVSRPSATLPLTFGYRANIGGALMKLNDAIISGTLKPIQAAGGQKVWGITNGSISGRWESAQLLGNLATLPTPNVDGSYLCGTDPQAASLYRYVKVYICSLQDIARVQSSDNTMATCDALSMSLGFTAEPARLGTVYSVSPPPSGCQTEAGLWSDTCQ
jgi:hypothetical protein